MFSQVHSRMLVQSVPSLLPTDTANFFMHSQDLIYDLTNAVTSAYVGTNAMEQWESNIDIVAKYADDLIPRLVSDIDAIPTFVSNLRSVSDA